MQEALDKITDIQRITLAPNEYLVISLPRDMREDDTEWARGELERYFGEQGKRVLIIHEGDIAFTKIAFEEKA